MRPLMQLTAIALASSALTLALGTVAHDGATELLGTPSAWWGPAHLTTAVTTLASAAGALGAAWHLASALLALAAGATGASGRSGAASTAGPCRARGGRGIAQTILERWGAPLVRRVAASAVVVGLTASPALAQEPAPSSDDLGWRPTVSQAHEAEPTPAGAGDPTTTPAPQSQAATSAPDTAAAAGPDQQSPQAPGSTESEGSAPGEAASTSSSVVEVGDSLWSITAEALGPEATDAAVAAAWPVVYRSNTDAIGPDPDVIHPGTRLALPDDLTASAPDAPSH